MRHILDSAESGEYQVGQSVDLHIYSETDLGFKAIVNDKHWGLLFRQEVFQPLEIGQELTGYIKKIREDGKLDLILYQEGNKDSDVIGQRILDKLTQSGGFLSINEKTGPELIYEYFGVSKKKYKIALGSLYKKRLIVISDQGIALAPQKPSNQKSKTR